MGFGLVFALLLSIIVFHILFSVVKKIKPLILNTILGIAIFWILNFMGLLNVQIDLLSTLIVAFGGVFGVLIVIALSLMGVPP
jgi:hypothetical protein